MYIESIDKKSRISFIVDEVEYDRAEEAGIIVEVITPKAQIKSNSWWTGRAIWQLSVVLAELVENKIETVNIFNFISSPYDIQHFNISSFDAKFQVGISCLPYHDKTNGTITIDFLINAAAVTQLINELKRIAHLTSPWRNQE